jgi:hypothetical protein
MSWASNRYMKGTEVIPAGNFGASLDSRAWGPCACTCATINLVFIILAGEMNHDLSHNHPGSRRLDTQDLSGLARQFVRDIESTRLWVFEITVGNREQRHRDKYPMIKHFTISRLAARESSESTGSRHLFSP